MYTQCPECKTVFRITEQQLSAARGKVRCGHCNAIYNAHGTLSDELPAKQTQPSPTSRPQAKVENRPSTAVKPRPAIHKPDLDLADKGPSATPVTEKNPPASPALKQASKKTSVESGKATTSKASQVITASKEPSKPLDSLAQHDDSGEIDALNVAKNKDEAGRSQNTGLNELAASLEGLDDADWETIDLGASLDNRNDMSFAFDDEDDDFLLDDEDELETNPAEKEIQSTAATPASSGSTEPEKAKQKDISQHVSNYLDDDAADELRSGESAESILDELNEQLKLSIDESESSDLGVPRDWLTDTSDDVIESLTSSRPQSRSRSEQTPAPQLDDEEKYELDAAILSSLSHLENEPEPSLHDKPVKHFKEDIVITDTDKEIPDNPNPIGQHASDIPLRLRDSMDIQPPQPRSLAKTAMLIVLVLLLLGGVASQAVLFRSTELVNQFPQLQPLLTDLCMKLPCRYSGQRAADQIQLVSRDIRQHPKQKNALLIKASIKNTANFAQNYPDILITLSDLSGTVVAQRRFQPKEYLGKLYHPFLQMKPGKPVHIALEVVDPGNAAINFEFTFL